jgi:hypothetical protein
VLIVFLGFGRRHFVLIDESVSLSPHFLQRIEKYFLEHKEKYPNNGKDDN